MSAETIDDVCSVEGFKALDTDFMEKYEMQARKVGYVIGLMNPNRGVIDSEKGDFIKKLITVEETETEYRALTAKYIHL